jgi:hypothetical protein
MKNQKENNCRVQGTQADEANYIKRQNPWTTRKLEILNSPQYQAEAMDREREKSTTRARRDTNVRPLNGGAAKKAQE